MQGRRKQGLRERTQGRKACGQQGQTDCGATFQTQHICLPAFFFFAIVLLLQTSKGSSPIKECSGKCKFCVRSQGKVGGIFVGGGMGKKKKQEGF